ncbi:LLM class flavin-dependent oxidoreductase [Mycolicibacterium sediminis]|uniref:LLM class flavin-dependent oxidoreductase n=1 Tax=Mycolicibacterium sediminis TaxID=1286180 RepID=UPI001FE526E6|nr:LLM class flavin-dependent oxidoreductase [Mycolicibacterium sediminis]
MFRPENPPEELVAAARTADEVGLDELWLWEDCFLHGGLSAAAIALANSSRLTVGVGVLPVPLRNVALVAMEIAALERTYPGRLRIGIGHGVQDWMAQVGERVGSPLTLLREYGTALTALLRGDTVTVDGRYVRLSGVGLQWPPTTAVELLFAATGPRTLHLSGELAAGTVLTGHTSPAATRDATAILRRASAGRPHRVVSYVACALDDDALARTRAEIGSDADDLVVHGTPDRIAAGVRRWVDAGADTVVLQPPVGPGATDFIRAVAGHVQPLLRG